jgi:UDP-N-acetylglucosamine 2-epimerase
MRILIYVHSPTWFTELTLLGRYLRSVGHDPLFYIVDFGHWTMRQFAEQLAADGIRCILECDNPPPRTGATDDLGLPLRGAPRRLDRRLARGLRGWLYRVESLAALEFRQVTKELVDAIADARSLIRTHQPDVVIMGGDNPGYTTASLIEGAHAEGVPVVLVPSTMSNGLEEAEVYAGDPRNLLNRPSARLAGELFPRWVYNHNGVDVLRCVPCRVLALEALGIAPPEPWAFNSGFAEAITAESTAMIDYAAAAGLPRERMIATGSPSDDAMFAILQNAAQERRKLYDELGLPQDRPMLLTPLPPDFLYVTGGRPQCDFREYRELVKAWIDALAGQNTCNVVVALHPSVEIETMRHIERPNVRIATRRTSELVPLCDLYVASVSSTIRWAIACGKPVINYDVYRYRYTDFMNIDGVLITEEYDEFRGWVRRLAAQPAELEALRQKQLRSAPRWGFLDGRCSERILKVLKDAVQQGARQAS